jgi:hypothetical protein
MLQAVEQAIVDRLTAALPPQVKVSAFPEQPIEQGLPPDVVTIYVRFAGVDLTPGKGQRTAIVQEGSMEFEIRLLVKDLRSHIGGYPLMEAVQTQLTGFHPRNADGYSFGLPGLQMTRMELLSRVSDYSFWDWSLKFRTDCVFERYL